MSQKQISQARIQALKKKRKLTDAELARRAGLTRQAVWNLFNMPIVSPSLRVVEGLAKALECSIDDLRG